MRKYYKKKEENDALKEIKKNPRTKTKTTILCVSFENTHRNALYTGLDMSLLLLLLPTLSLSFHGAKFLSSLSLAIMLHHCCIIIASSSFDRSAPFSGLHTHPPVYTTGASLASTF